MGPVGPFGTTVPGGLPASFAAPDRAGGPVFSSSQAAQVLQAAGIDPSTLSPQDKEDLARALSFANGQEVQDALAGKNPGYATSILWRAGLRGTNNPVESPVAQAIYSALAQRLAQNPKAWAQGHDPANDWAGKSHNFFVENPWAAPIAEVGAALIPGVGPGAAAAIDAAIGGISHANIGSNVPNPSNPFLGAAEGAALGYGANKAAGALGLFGHGGSSDLPPELDPTSPDYNPGALDPNSPSFDPALAKELEQNPGLLTGQTSLASLTGGGGGGHGLSAVDLARIGLAGLDAANATQLAGKADTLRTKALSGVSANPEIGPLPTAPYNPYHSAAGPAPVPTPPATPPSVPAVAPATQPPIVAPAPTGLTILPPPTVAPAPGAVPRPPSGPIFSPAAPEPGAPKSPLATLTELLSGGLPKTAGFPQVGGPNRVPLLALLGGH